MLEAPRESLQRARRDRSTWEDLAFAPALAGQGQAYDLNRAARFGVLWALQYDRRPDDLPLARFLLRQEIIRYEETVPSGLAPDLELAGFLVCEHRQLDDVWLHWRAKNISFDTALGYRTPYLLTAGVEATAEAVRAGSHPDRERILHEILDARNPDGTPTLPTPRSRNGWKRNGRGSRPARPPRTSRRGPITPPAVSTEMTRGVTRDATLAAAPAKKGRRAGLPVRYRDLSLARARRLILAAARTGNTSYQALTSRIAGYRTVTDRNRHRARKSKSPSAFGHASRKDTVTRIAPAVITMANNPA